MEIWVSKELLFNKKEILAAVRDPESMKEWIISNKIQRRTVTKTGGDIIGYLIHYGEFPQVKNWYRIQ